MIAHNYPSIYVKPFIEDTEVKGINYNISIALPREYIHPAHYLKGKEISCPPGL
jgi:hypothetical protein